MAKLGQFAGRNLRMAMGAPIVYVGGKKSQAAAPKSELDRIAERELQRRRRRARKRRWHPRGSCGALRRRAPRRRWH
eukprot:8078863-Pyramimonas_sp.AAC.1